MTYRRNLLVETDVCSEGCDKLAKQMKNLAEAHLTMYAFTILMKSRDLGSAQLSGFPFWRKAVTF